MTNLGGRRENAQILSRTRIKTKEVNKEIPMVEGKGKENRIGARIIERKIDLVTESREETMSVVHHVRGRDASEIVLKSRVDIEIIHLNLTVGVETGGDILVTETRTHQRQQTSVVALGMNVAGKTAEGTKAIHAREKIGTKFWNLENILAVKNLIIEYHPQKNHRVMYR